MDMADNSKLRMNLSAIKKVDPYAKTIVGSSSHVAFYTFNSDCNEWEKTDVEGALFVYNRSGQPFYSIFINNRINTTSFVEPITAHLELQSQPPFLLYRNERSRIRGFWFYNSVECGRIGSLVSEIVQTTGTQINAANAASNPAKSDIYTLLTNAQQEQKGDGTKNLTPIPNTPCNVMKFFATVKPTPSNYNPPISLSVEQLEQQQRIQTPRCPQEEKKTNTMQSVDNSHSLKSFQQANKTNPVNMNSLMLKKDAQPGERLSASAADNTNNIFNQASSSLSMISSTANGHAPLDQRQLVQAFSYLILNDKEFVRKIHEAYVKAFENL